MRIPHETIYLSLFVQSRGALRHELTRQLRSGHAIRRPGPPATDRSRSDQRQAADQRASRRG